jgi:hypothetical protein
MIVVNDPDVLLQRGTMHLSNPCEKTLGSGRRLLRRAVSGVVAA